MKQKRPRITSCPRAASEPRASDWETSSLGGVLHLVLFACTALVGCSHLPRRSPAGQEVIIARQLSQQGMDAMHQGQLPQAEERFSQAIEHCPSNTTARYQLANCLWKRGARSEAIDQLAQAIEMVGHDDVEMMVELGYMQANEGEFDQALQLAERSIRVAPDNALAWQLRGDVLRERHDWTGALASYHRSLTHDRRNAEVQLSVAEVYHQLNRPARVLATLNRLEDDLPVERQPARMLVLKAQALRQLDRCDEAVQLLTRVQRDRPLTYEGMLQLAQAQAAAGRYGEAQLTIQRALSQADDSQQASLRQLLASISQPASPQATTTLR